MDEARLERVQRLTINTARKVLSHQAELKALTSRVEGLHEAHRATLIAVEASTTASERLAQVVDKLSDKLDLLGSRIGEHEVKATKQENSLSRTAIALWTTTLFGFCSFALLLLHPFAPRFEQAWVNIVKLLTK